jgi:hypothetical protein
MSYMADMAVIHCRVISRCLYLCLYNMGKVNFGSGRFVIFVAHVAVEDASLFFVGRFSHLRYSTVVQLDYTDE